MRVALSMLTLVPGISGGSETYGRELTQGLARVGSHDYSVLLPRIAPDAGGGLPVAVAEEYAASTTTAGRLLAMGAARLRPGRLRRYLADAEVVHYPLTVRVPPVAGPSVITLLDVQHLDLPHLFSRGERLFRRVTYDRAAQHSTQVIVISEFVRGRVIDRLGLDPERVHAIWLGVDTTSFRPDPSVIREPLLLYPARPWPHKNHARLLEAFALLRGEDPDLRLILTGAGHAGTALPAGVEAANVARPELIELYRRAACTVFPSLYEGFGLPPLEAMACGCPVAASTAGSLPEVCGDAAVLFDPHDPEAIAAGVREALRRTRELEELGPAHAARFTWDATARAHDAVYALALA